MKNFFIINLLCVNALIATETDSRTQNYLLQNQQEQERIFRQQQDELIIQRQLEQQRLDQQRVNDDLNRRRLDDQRWNRSHGR